MQDARSRLLLAIVASGALHFLLIYGVTVRAPAPVASPIVARLQGEPLPVSPGAALAARRARLDAASPLTRSPNPLNRGAAAAPPQPRVLPTPEPPRPVTLPAPPPDSALPNVAMPLLTDPTWYTAQQLDVYPRALSPLQPEYPEAAAQEGIRGEVTLLLMVDERGAVKEVSVVRALPEGYFDAAAVAAFRIARFKPAQKDGRTVRSRILVKVAFDPASRSGGQPASLSAEGHEVSTQRPTDP
jgi:periplasmic protein TonB